MRLPDNWRKAPLTAVLAIVTIAAWVIAALFQQEYWASENLGFWPANTVGAIVPVWLQPLTAPLAHAGFPHLLFNMVILVFCGRPVESVLGSPAMAILYLLGAYASAGSQYLVDPQAIAPMIGASGAISAVIGAYAMLFGRNKVKVSSPTLALWLNALWLMAAWVVLQICIGIALQGSSFITGGGGVQVAVAAHIGGFIIGVLLANPLLLFKYRKA
jgi:membrane associated rhomboid family serine protease